MPHRWLVTLDSYTNATYGRDLSSAVIDGVCVACSQPTASFSNPEIEAFYRRTGLCEACQRPQSPIDLVIPFPGAARK